MIVFCASKNNENNIPGSCDDTIFNFKDKLKSFLDLGEKFLRNN